MVGLGDLTGGNFFSEAYGVPTDGSVVVGYSYSAGGREAFIWDDTNGMRSLRDVLVTDYGLDLTGWRPTTACGISGDGLNIVGSGYGPNGVNEEAWTAVLGISEPAMPCFAVNKIKVIDKINGTKGDKITIKGSLKLGDDQTFDPDTDQVALMLSWNNEAILAEPVIGSYTEIYNDNRGPGYRYEVDLEGGGKAILKLFLESCFWSGTIKGQDASTLYDGDGATLKLTISSYFGQNSFSEWDKRKVRDRKRIAIFKAESQVDCCIDLDNGLVAYYPFNGNANDESGNGNHGTADGATLATDRSGDPDSAYSFDGVDDFVEVPNSADFSFVNEITITAWINRSADSSQPQAILYKGDTYFEPFFIRVDYNDDLMGYVRVDDPQLPVNGGYIPINAWHHVAMTYDSSSLKIYVDSVEVGSIAKSGTIYTDNENIFIGKSGSLDSWPLFNGLIDEIRIYNRALSEPEIQVLSSLP